MNAYLKAAFVYSYRVANAAFLYYYMVYIYTNK